MKTASISMDKKHLVADELCFGVLGARRAMGNGITEGSRGKRPVPVRKAGLD